MRLGEVIASLQPRCLFQDIIASGMALVARTRGLRAEFDGIGCALAQIQVLTTPFKASAARRHHIPKQERKATTH
jgi:hypothetical protein